MNCQDKMANTSLIFYKDLPLDFTAHPVTGDVRSIKNEVAIKNSLRNLLSTKKGSKPFFPQYGTNLQNHLFNNINAFTKRTIQKEIQDAVRLFEPRVSVENVSVEDDRNGSGVQVQIFFTIGNLNTKESLTLTFTRTT